MTQTRIRIAAVGLGWVSQNRHLPTIAASRSYTLSGVIDSKPENARAVGRKYGVRTAVSRQLSNVDWLDEVDAVVIGAPPFAHAELIEQAIGLGKHVLTEKPFVMEVADGERLAAAAEQAARVLSVVHNFQFSRSFLRLERDIAAGRIGAIRNIWATQLSNPERRLPVWYGDLPGGLFFDESPHLLYLVRRLLPGLVLCESRLTGSRRGDSTPAEVYAQLRAPGGETATVLMNFEAALSEWHLVVSGDNGTADVDVFRDIYLFFPNDRRHAPRDILRTGFTAVVGHLWGTAASGLLHLSSKLDYGNREVFSRFAAAIGSASLHPDYIGSHEAMAVRKLQQEILTGGH